MQIELNEIKTERLILRPILFEDWQVLSIMYSNPKVMKYIYDGSTFTTEQAKNRARSFSEHWKNHGFGMWLLTKQSNHSVVGYGGFRYFENEQPEFANQIELGYIIDAPFWGCGYASEAVCAFIQAGFHQFNMKRILATILPENIASQKIAEKAGLKHTFDAKFSGLLHSIYEANKPE